MQISNKTYILILAILIIGLSLTSYWRFQKPSGSLPGIKLPEIKTPETSLEELTLPAKESYQEWVSPDGKLKLTYSNRWIPMNEAFLEYGREAGIMLTKSEILFFAYQAKLEKQTFSFLTVNAIDSQKKPEEVVEEIKQTAEEQDGEIEITILKTENGTAWLEMISRYPNQPSFYSKGKVILGNEKTYLIVLTSPQKDWPQFKEEAEEVLNSAQLLLNQ